MCVYVHTNLQIMFLLTLIYTHSFVVQEDAMQYSKGEETSIGLPTCDACEPQL